MMLNKKGKIANSSPAVLNAAKLLLQPQAEASEEADFWDSLSPELQARLRRSQESPAAGRTEPLAEVLARFQQA